MHLRNTLQHYRINQKIRYFSQMLSKSPHIVLLLSGICFLVSILLYWSIFVRQEKEGTGLHAFYYGNTGWEGDSWKAALLETEISSATENFREAEQHLNNQFSVAWKGYILIPATGEYTFSTNSDDGSWVFIDDTLVVDNGGPHGLQEVQGTTYLEKGLHKIQIKYFQIGGASRLEVFWAKGTEPKRTLTSKVLFPSDARIARLWYRVIQKVLLALMIIPALMLLIIEKQIGFQEQASTKKQPNALVLLVICILIPIWQSTFALSASKLDSSYRMTATGGLYNMNRYFYFYYYLGLFPLAASGDAALVYNKQDAEKFAIENPSSLRMDIDQNARSGDSGRIWLFLPAALLRGQPDNFDTVWINAAIFSLALTFLVIMMWRLRKLPLGIFLVLFLGSHPFQLYEIYATNSPANGTTGNVFALAITISVFLLAIHLPVIFNKKIAAFFLWSLPIISGVILATARHIRTEFIPVIISVAFCYLTIQKLRWGRRIILTIILFSTFFIGSQAWENYFKLKHQRTVQFLEKIEGNPYNGPRFIYHGFWHPLFVGLGDFGQKHGYANWNDNVAINYASPLLKTKLGDDLNTYFIRDEKGFFEITKSVLNQLKEEGFPGDTLKPLKRERFANEYEFLTAIEKIIGREQTEKYKTLLLKYSHQYAYTHPIALMPEYDEILRQKIVGDIINHPFWFLNILKKRTIRILTDVAPAGLLIGGHRLYLPIGGIIFIPTLCVLIYLRSWELLKLLCFALPLALAAFIIHSGKGMTYYSIFLQITLAVYGTSLWNVIVWSVSFLQNKIEKLSA